MGGRLISGRLKGVQLYSWKLLMLTVLHSHRVWPNHRHSSRDSLREDEPLPCTMVYTGQNRFLENEEYKGRNFFFEGVLYFGWPNQPSSRTMTILRWDVFLYSIFENMLHLPFLLIENSHLLFEQRREVKLTFGRENFKV